MKKYTRPELSISKFDVEDVITTSGVMGTGADAIASYGDLYTSSTLQDDTTKVNADTTAVVYFNWQ